nr:FadD7 family fatty acid--CoA ligase [Streptomyces sp. NBC_00830]
MDASTTPSTDAGDRYRPPTLTGLADPLDRQLRDRPGAEALVTGGDRTRLSYETVAALADNLATELRGTGLRQGQAVGLVSANNAEFVVALLAAARAGLVVAPLDPALPARERSARISALGAQAVLVGPPAADAAPTTDRAVPLWPLRVDSSPAGRLGVTLEAETPPAPRGLGAAPELTPEDALVLFTAGTTDRAKMVPLTHANVAASVKNICACYKLGPEDATVAVMPFFHGHGLLAGLLATLATGGCVLLPKHGRFSAHTFWDDARAVSATWFTAVPTIHEILLERSAREYPGPRAAPLRFVRSCSAPLSPAISQAMERMLGAPVLNAYGMTESTHQATGEPLPKHSPLKSGSVGRPTSVDVQVRDRGGHPCEADRVGEVWVRGPTVARGYLANRPETAASFRDGWFRTGDLGSLDTDGYLFLTGRIKDLINRGGEKISPEHVEDILTDCPGVAEAAVFAIPDATYGQRVGAAVVLKEDADIGPPKILAYCRDHLARYEVPDRLAVVSTLTHTAKGSLDRRAVADLYGH